MPCDSIILNRVELGKLDAKLLEAALRELGAVGVYVTTGTVFFSHEGTDYMVRRGQLEFQEGRANIADLVKRHYSVQVIKESARVKGWQVRKVGEFKYQVVRRAL